MHFIRQVGGDGTISVLNEDFDVGESLAYEYVWATIDTKDGQSDQTRTPPEFQPYSISSV